MKIINKIIHGLIALALISGVGYYFRSDIDLALDNLNQKINPCAKPITYSIGKFDDKFGISRDDFLGAISRAAQIWQEPMSKQLFAYAPDGGIKINLKYDARQDSTNKLAKLGFNIQNDQATYDALKIKYDAMTKSYRAQKSEFDNLVSDFETRKKIYEAAVAEANERGGAKEFAKLERDKNNLNKLIMVIKDKQTKLNSLTDDLNAVANVINRLIHELNLKVDNYNTIGAEAAGEFQEGEYVSNAAGQAINIYQFNDQTTLIKLLAHELGHALGLEHLDNPQAIMYRLNQSGNEKITDDDIAALKTVCKIK